jgi:Zinc finger, ZZ type
MNADKKILIDSVPCFKCDGKKVNRSGKPCKKCNGTGMLDSTFIAEIMKIIQEEITLCTPITFNKLIEK